jgi:hypothetical protein
MAFRHQLRGIALLDKLGPEFRAASRAHETPLHLKM